MNQHKDSTARPSRRWMVAAALITAIGAAGITGASIAGEGGMHGHGHGRGHHGPMDAATAAKHIDRMVERIAADGTPQQKARLTEIAKALFADVQPLRAQMRDSHKRMHELLKQPTVDRVALEQLRTEQMTRADHVSKRVTAAIADAADVLTPAQRERFLRHMKKMHG